MANIYGWDLLPLRVWIFVLKPFQVFALPRKFFPLVLFELVWRPFLLIAFKLFQVVLFQLYIGNILVFLFIAVLFILFIFFILISFHFHQFNQIYNLYTFRCFIESSKVWKKLKPDSWRNKCLAFYLYIFDVFVCDTQSLYICIVDKCVTFICINMYKLLRPFQRIPVIIMIHTQSEERRYISFVNACYCNETHINLLLLQASSIHLLSLQSYTLSLKRQQNMPR